MSELDNQFTTREELIVLVNDRWALWCSTVDGLTPEQMETSGTCGHWSAKDLLGHIATWDQVAIEKLQSIMSGEPRLPWGESMDEFNERMAKSLEDQSVASLRKLMDLKHAQLVVALEDASGASAEQVQAMLEDLPVETWEHYDEHRQQVVERFD